MIELSPIDWTNFTHLIISFLINALVILVLVRVLYYNSTRRKDYLFTYILISVIVFFISYLLEELNIGIGFALGLFAIFGIIRYRTRQIPIREMTYLFIVIGTSVLNALYTWSENLAVFVFANLSLVVITYLLERVFLLKHESRKVITYDKIENIKPENYEALKADLEERTGLHINNVEVGRVDFLRDTARVFVYYDEHSNMMNAADDEVNETDDDD